MSANLHFVNVVKDYALPLGLDAEFADDECLWQTSDGVTLTIELESDGATAIIRTVIGLWPPIGDTDVEGDLRTLLAANLMGVGTRGALFAIDDDAGEILLYRRLSCANATAESFAQAVNDLHAVAREFAEQTTLGGVG